MNIDAHDHETLLRALHSPQRLAGLGLAQWDRIIPLARTTGVLNRIAARLSAIGLIDTLPGPVRWHLVAACRAAEYNRHRIGWELACLARVFGPCEYPLILLKGAAYVAADLPPAEGRIASDVDLLVPHELLTEVESRLLANGWRPKELPRRDAAYFRRWLHEIPPLAHGYRKTELDVHHNILPRTDRLRVDPVRLLEASRPITGTPFRVLSPADMVLHAAVHLFRNGDFTRGLRDFVDIDLLIRHFAAKTDFWATLIDRSERLKLRQPCWLALHYTEHYLQTPIPRLFRDRLVSWQPLAPLRKLFDRVVFHTMSPAKSDAYDAGRYRAIWLMAHYPVPHLKTMFEPLFWMKRLPARM